MRETYCDKCQGMVNGNGCEAEACPVNEGEGFLHKLEREEREAAETAKAKQPHA